VDRDLARSSLPPRIEETPNLYVSVPVAIEWIARTGHDLELMELGLLGAQKASMASLLPVQRAAIIAAPTGLRRLETLVALSRLEDSALQMTIRYEADSIRVNCNMGAVASHPFIGLAEWLNLQAVISVVRSVVGPLWCPSEACFVSSNRMPYIVLAEFPNTRILMGQRCTSMTIERAALARTTHHTIAAASNQVAPSELGLASDRQLETWDFASLLRMLVQPYLDQGRPDVAFAAELSGISTRTLQRRLKLCGSSYSQVLQEATFELACKRLDDPSLKIIDIAMMAGYRCPQHFTRAFRRFGGITPSEYRHCNLSGKSTGVKSTGVRSYIEHPFHTV
jgi:AraC-like DNA-binding protein